MLEAAREVQREIEEDQRQLQLEEGVAADLG